MDLTIQALTQEWVLAERGLPEPSKAFAESLTQMDPSTLARIHAFLKAAEDEPHISHRLRHLIWVAVDSVVSHLFPGGATTHAVMALKHGATPRQLLEALEISAFASVRGYEVGLPVVMSAVSEAGVAEPPPSPDLSADAREVKRTYQARMGFWADWMETTVRSSPEQLRAHLELGYRAPEASGLSSKDRQLILFACFACPAVCDQELMKTHASEAIRRGASQAELLQTLRLANCIGLHSIMVGVHTFPDLLRQTQPSEAVNVPAPAE